MDRIETQSRPECKSPELKRVARTYSEESSFYLGFTPLFSMSLLSQLIVFNNSLWRENNADSIGARAVFRQLQHPENRTNQTVVNRLRM